MNVNQSEGKGPGLEPGIGIVFSPWVPGAEELANTLARRVNGAARSWVLSLTELEAHGQPQTARLLVTVGGDGTILRAVSATVRSDVPLVGVNMGRVGFMTELSAAEAPERIESYARGEAGSNIGPCWKPWSSPNTRGKRPAMAPPSLG